MIGVTGLAAFVAGAVETARRLGAPRALGEWAKARGHRYTPADPKAKIGARAFGARGDVLFTIDFCRVRDEPRTRIVADVPRGRVPRIALVQRSRFERMFGSALPVLGLPEIDDAYIVHGLEGPEARDLTLPLLAAFERLDRRSDVRLFADAGRVTLMWAGVEPDPRVLDAGLAIVLATVAWEKPDAPYR